MRIIFIFLFITSINVMFSQVRDPRPKDQANVFWNGRYSLFCLTTDREIKPNNQGIYEFWGTTNEDPQPRKYSLRKGETYTVYKFISYDECLTFCNQVRKSKGMDLIQNNTSQSTVQSNTNQNNTSQSTAESYDNLIDKAMNEFTNNQFSAALGLYRKAEKIKPNSALSNMIARCELFLKMYSEAIVDIDKFISNPMGLTDQLPGAYTIKGMALAGLGKDEACTYLKKGDETGREAWQQFCEQKNANTLNQPKVSEPTKQDIDNAASKTVSSMFPDSQIKSAPKLTEKQYCGDGIKLIRTANDQYTIKLEKSDKSVETMYMTYDGPINSLYYRYYEKNEASYFLVMALDMGSFGPGYTISYYNEFGSKIWSKSLSVGNSCY
jgi:hypothetical protein